MRSTFLLILVTGLCAVVVGAALALLPPGRTFTDDDGNIHEGNIEAIAAEGITKGCNPPTNDLYCPSSSVTRGQMAAFIRRAFSLPSSSTDYFIDDNDSVFEGDINAVAAAGVTKGCNPPTNDRFCPDGNVTREQMAAFLRRAFGYPATSTDYFIDDGTSIFQADINAIAKAGVTKGCNPPTNNRYCPTDLVKRDQMASFFARALGLAPITPPPPTVTTTTSDATTTTTTMPATDHPQSGDSWAFLDCDNATGTCSYAQATAESQLNIFFPLLPPDYCVVYDPFEPWKCSYSRTTWNFGWWDSDGSEVIPSSCSFNYNGGFLSSVTCKMPIAGAALGEYRGELCRTEKTSLTCVETLLTVYFNVIE